MSSIDEKTIRLYEWGARCFRALSEDICRRVGVDINDPENSKVMFLDVYNRFVGEVTDLKEWQTNICNLLSTPLENGDRVLPADAYEVLSGLIERGLPEHNDPAPTLIALWSTAAPELQPGIEAAMKVLGIDPYPNTTGHEE